MGKKQLVLTLLVLAMHVHAVMEEESLQDCVKKEEACVRCMQEINKEKIKMREKYRTNRTV
jgi:hypothetical protein